MKLWFFLGISGIMLIYGCKNSSDDKLPYLGHKTMVDGQPVYHKIRPYRYLNQDSIWISDDTLKNYVYVADFFFTSCPSICPKVMKEMTRIYEAFKDEPRVKLLSFTIDPVRDNVPRLKLYADNLGINHDKWYFLTGEKEFTFELANDFFVVALEDPEAPGGFDHSGKIILVDREGHVRSFSEGTDASQTPRLIEDIKKLLRESFAND
ncbi:MAG: SCO family protein [Saprospiraceae bacterium]|nr:SCO family protein [Saprospiraceae bacterium]